MNVSEILEIVTGKKITRLETGSECELVGEIAFALGEVSNETIEVDVEVDEKISDTYINRMLDLGAKWGDRKAAYYNSAFFMVKNNRNLNSLVIKKTVTDWTFDRNDSVFKNTILDYSGGCGYIPLVASFIVDKYLTGTKGVLHLVSKTIPDIYKNLFVLMFYGNKLVENIVEIENVSVQQAEWFAYITTQRQYGRMLSSVDSVAKYNWLKENDVKDGDILLLYRIGKNQDKTKRELISCYIARVDSYNQFGISFYVISSIETVLTQVHRVSIAKFKDKSIEDYTQFNARQQTIQFTSLGVDYLTYDEEYMVMKPSTDDGSVQLMVMPDDNGGWDIQKVEMDTLDTIYAVLVNRGIRFNKERFIEMYFTPRGVIPIYEQYKDHQPTEYEDMTKAEILEKYGG